MALLLRGRLPQQTEKHTELPTGLQNMTGADEFAIGPAPKMPIAPIDEEAPF